jgi:hypothetical protein
MVIHPRRLAPALLWLLAMPARAGGQELGESGRAPPVAAQEEARLDLRGALAAHDDTVTSGGQRSRAQGSAVTHLALAGSWLPSKARVGVAADLALERFALTPEQGGTAAVASGIEAGAGVVARYAQGPFALDGQLGYAYLRVPFVGAADVTALSAHGPEVAARLALALGRLAGLEAGARAMPRTFGARYASDAVDLHRYALGAGARLGSLELAALRWSALVGYEMVLTGGKARDFSLEQAQHRVGLGLRAAWPMPVAQPPPAPPVVVAEPPPNGRVRGRVRAARGSRGVAAGAPMAGVTVTPAAGAAVTTDAEGRFVLEGLPPALTRLALSKDGFAPAEEVVAVPRRGDVDVEVELQPQGPPPVGVVLGFVRSEDGTPVGAALKLPELGITARADRKGRFRLEVPPGRYALTIEAPNFVTQTKSVVVGPGEQTIFNLDLQRHR